MPENPFDGMQAAAYTVVSDTMGYNATWIPSNGSAPGGIVGRVLFKNPTQNKELGGIDYDPNHYEMEYFAGVFDALKPLVDLNNVSETVIISGNNYLVQGVKQNFDGKTFIATLAPL